MEITYDALKRMIQAELELIMQSNNNPALESTQPQGQTTREYCKDLVKGELSKEFLDNLNRIEKATKGSLDKKD